MTTTHPTEWTAEDSDALDVEILVNVRRRTVPTLKSKMNPGHRRVMATAAHVLAEKGRNHHEIAAHLGVDVRSVQRWKKAFAQSGGAA
ncbi:hypothetical protein IM25_00060 [Rhodococcus sp. p52]|jgi:hypothetical protein|uniref:helix-turn-helix domain-containing protein n=1 Tax=Rhodococcus sp. p52 TaxID=935199 RepID=UPI00051A4131|nr:helix-turn-helix domain-containing protein [Rhodococcus sp. p52]AOD20225.1 hypothetical protein IM25_00060 [Rhodococcus sp. p52]